MSMRNPVNQNADVLSEQNVLAQAGHIGRLVCYPGTLGKMFI